jgi:diguanylate cyclase (GGDEF)-like protein
MDLHLETLLAADSFVIAMAGIVMLGAAYRGTASRLAKWWGAGCLLAAFATGILSVKSGLPDISTRVTVATLINLASACEWATARAARNASIPLPAMLAGSVAWIVALLIPRFDSPHFQMALLCGVGAAYSASAAVEMWQGRDEALAPRWALFGLFVLDVSVNAAGVASALLGQTSVTALPALTNPYGLVYFEAFLLWVGGAFFVLALGADRVEGRLKQLAFVDMLTGVATRRAFMADAAKAIEDSRRKGQPFSLIAFDLDHFKLLNDTCGHAAGDRALQQFGQIAQQMMRDGDFIGRIGGEEFAAAIPGGSAAVAYVIAERIRAGFAHAISLGNGESIEATVSAGVTEALPGETLDQVLEAADGALYVAKGRGRNRVERADRRAASTPMSNVNSVVRRTG